MNGQNWMDLVMGQMQKEVLLETNQYTRQYGLVLSNDDTELLIEERKGTLKEQRRIEFGESILPQIIYAFCDSSYINQASYAKILARLQEIFYLYKNEMMDEITDEELIHFMKEQFETICYGDLDYLEHTCLDVFAQAIRAGYRGYIESNGYGEYDQFDEVKRWDSELYQAVLKELCWR